VLARGQGCLVLAQLGDTPVAGSMFLHFGKSAIFKFGASDAAHHSLRPNNLVMWRAIEWHARQGFEHLDFGRTSIANKGLRHFKLGWGTSEHRIEYTRFDRRTARFVSTPDQSSGWHNSVIKLLPSALARALGAAAYKHVA
jgi:lipid II:glycine glycyltransferase (peptidoglycan interpeptide bridge formation enzyme)